MPSPTNVPQEIPRLSRSSDALTSAERWQAITKRDATMNNFVYGVLTTGIYCRPSCPARLARRANVQFYDTPSQAEKAGFRPCKRCKPQSDQTAAQSNPQTAMVERACGTIREGLAARLKPRLQDLASQAGLTTSHFHRVFKKKTGVTPGQYARQILQESAHPSPNSITPGTLSDSETSRFDFVDETWQDVLDLDDESLALPAAGLSAAVCEAPIIMDNNNGWNEFDTLLAADQGQISVMDPFSIDPRIISAMNDHGARFS